MAMTKILTINDCGRKFAGRHLQTAITYILDPNKTQNMRYVTGINCQPEKAFDQMLATKQKFGKTDKRQGYHIIISFEEEDVEPGTAFEIIRKFAEEYLGQGYEAIYAVHDNTAHTHGHIIFNSVNGITGRKYRYEKEEMATDLRISTLPSVYGEKVVLRLLGNDRDSSLMDVRRLGMDEKQEEIFGRMLKAPFGIILVTGPTGSGKSTTLYAALSQLAEKKINCVTVEDPVEKLINGVTQVQVNAKAGLTFATALRSILRQDPDVIMVGEIRDEETADIGVRAAVTGHLVLSTLHTNDCVSAVYRLQNMGIPFYMIAAATTGVVAQRLVKVLCPHCRRKIKAGQQTKRLLYEVSGKEAEEVWEAVGCEECLNTGYSHRRAIYEMFELNETTKNMIRDGETAEKIRRYQRERGFLSLQEQAAQMVMCGEMDMEEAEKVIYSAD